MPSYRERDIMKNIIMRSLSVVVSAACLFTFSPLAFGQDNNENYQQRLGDISTYLNHTLSEKEIDEQIKETSRRTGESPDSIASRVEKSVRDSVLDTARFSVRSGNTQLPRARHTGDIFVSNNSSFFVWKHGHTGIYVNRDDIVEAVGMFQNAHRVSRKNSVAAGGASILEVKTSQGNRDKAARRAIGYIGSGYNADITDTNRNDWGGLNCSQLVWAAYYYGAGIDLDTGSGEYVWPYDIKNSGYVREYQYVQ